MENTLVLLKPDAVQRGIVGDIITRFEKVGLKIVAAKMVLADKALLGKHYPATKEVLERLGNNTLHSYEEMGLNPDDQFTDTNPIVIGAQVRDWLVDFMVSGPVFAMVLEGPHCIEIVRKIVGATLPQKALPGTIRGDYSFDSSYLANTNNRPIRNLIHASANIEEATTEIALWFTKDEIHSYDTIHQRHMAA